MSSLCPFIGCPVDCIIKDQFMLKNWIPNFYRPYKLAKWLLHTEYTYVSKHQHKCSMHLFMWTEPAVMRLFEQGCDETVGSYLIRLRVLFQETANLFCHLHYITRSVPNPSELYCCLLPTQTAAFYSRVSITIFKKKFKYNFIIKCKSLWSISFFMFFFNRSLSWSTRLHLFMH